MIRCSRCGDEKPPDEFHRSKSNPTGRHRQCKMCRSWLGKEAALKKSATHRERTELLANGLQRCTTCHEVRGLDGFYRSSRAKSGRKGQCIPCYTAEGDAYRSRPETKELIRSRVAAAMLADPEKFRRSRRNSLLKQKYGITINEYDEMLTAQGDACAICRTTPPRDGVLYVDHCHDSGRVRQLLCHPCNAGLGFFRDSPDLLVEARSYVIRHSA